MDEHQLARIRLLSSRFLELQGLRVAFAGGTIAIALGSYLIAAEPIPSGGMLAMLVAFGLMAPGQWWLHRYYAATVGRQVPAPRNPWPTVVFFWSYFVIATYLDRRFPAIPAGAPTAAIVLLISVAVAIRDWPWRGYYLGAAAAVALAFSATVLSADVIHPGRTLSITVFTAGLSFVPIGLLDHWLLVRLMVDARVVYLQGTRLDSPSSGGRGSS